MDPTLIGLIAIAIFLVLVFLSMPIAIAFALVGTLGLLMLRGVQPAIALLGATPFGWGTTAMLVPLPLFILMGQFAFHCGISKDLYNTAYKFIGRLPGGLALATNLACTAFGACCGVSMAACATFGAIAYPEMAKYKYDNKLATGCIVAGGALSSLIPPSCVFILYGFLTQVSIGKLFIAGILPGLLLSGIFVTQILLMSIRTPQLAPRGPSFSIKEMFVSLKGVLGMLALFLLVIGGLYAGIFTPSEAGSVGASGALIISLAMRRLTLSNLKAALKDTAKTTCFIGTLIIGANIFNSFLTVAGITNVFSDWIRGLDMAPMLVLILILIIYIPLGMFMDIGAIVLLTIPIVVPPLVQLGFDPIYIGVLIVVMSELGFMTPPVGLNSFVVSGVTKVPLAEVFKGTVPFSISMLACVVILVAFPQISLVLPRIMM